MPKSRISYPAEFRQQMVELVRSGRSPGPLTIARLVLQQPFHISYPTSCCFDKMAKRSLGLSEKWSLLYGLQSTPCPDAAV